MSSTDHLPKSITCVGFANSSSMGVTDDDDDDDDDDGFILSLEVE